MSNTSQIGAGQIGSAWIGADENTVGSSSNLQQITTIASLASVIPGFGFGGVMVMRTTLPSLSAVITGFSMNAGMSMLLPIASIKSVPSGFAVLPRSTGTTILVDNVDRTAYFEMGISGTLQVSSLGNATLPMSNVGTGTPYLTTWQPSKFNKVQIFYGTYCLFGGYVNTVERVLYANESGVNLQRYTVNVWAYGAILDRVFVAEHFEIYDGALANIIMYALVTRYLTSRGYLWGGSGGDIGPFFPPFDINYWSFTQVCQYVCDKANWSFYVDQFKVLRMFGIDSTVRPAPFTLTKANSKFETLKQTRGSEYYNKVIVRNSQDLGSKWTDTFAGDADAGTGFYAPLTAALNAKPQVLVNDIAVTVVDPGTYGRPWDFYWLNFGVQRNPALGALSSSDTVKVRYLSNLSYVVTRQDDSEIAIYGAVEKLVELKNITSLDDMGIIADGLLAKGIQDLTVLDAVTQTAGIEPGQILTVNASPMVTDFMVESVNFQQQAADLFFFTIKGSDANVQQRNMGTALYQRLLTQALQPKDRIQTPVGFALFVSVAGQTNPGSYTGTILGAIRTLPVTGIGVKCTLDFQSVKTGPPTTVDVIIDVLLNGVSIFPSGDAAKMVFPAGATEPQEVFIFKNDPEEGTAGDTVTLNCIQADPNAYDGVLEWTVQG